MGAFVVGTQLASSVTGVGGHQLGVQVELTPAGARTLLRGDVEALTDAVVPLADALGDRGVRLVERLADAPSWQGRLDLLDEALGSDEPAALSPEVDWLRAKLVSSQGRARVEPLLDETGWSRRHVTGLFRRELGVTPKAYARLLRFEHATALVTSGAGRSLAAAAITAGYYDQSHLTREFVALAGMTPRTYAADVALVPEVRFVQDDRASEDAGLVS
jgi:AraC-like DNA-binding protein